MNRYSRRTVYLFPAAGGGGGGGAPTDATYIVASADATLTNEILLVTAINRGTDAARLASSPQGGWLWYTSDTGINYWYSGAAWFEISRAETAIRLAQLAERAHSSLTGLTTGDPHTQYVTKALYDANTVLAANSDDTPAALTMGASTILARLAAGNIKAATPAEIKTILATSTADISDFTTAVRLLYGTVLAYKSSGAQTIQSATHTAITLDAEDHDDLGQHFTSAAALTGTVAKSSSSNPTILVGTGTLFTTELTVGQVIDVPGTATERRVVIFITDDTHLTVNTAFVNTASGQTATRVNSTITILTTGNYELEGQVDFVSNSSNSRLIALWKNGVNTGTRLAQTATSGGALGPRTPVLTGYRSFAQWDYVELSGWQDTGSPLDVNAGSASTFLSCRRV